MHDHVKELRKHGGVKSIMLEPRVNTPFGMNYSFTCTCIMGSTKFPKSATTFEYYRVARLLSVQQRS